MESMLFAHLVLFESRGVGRGRVFLQSGPSFPAPCPLSLRSETGPQVTVFFPQQSFPVSVASIKKQITVEEDLWIPEFYASALGLSPQARRQRPNLGRFARHTYSSPQHMTIPSTDWQELCYSQRHTLLYLQCCTFKNS